MSLNTWLLFLVVSIVPVVSPGPAIFLTIKNSITHGARRTLFSATGNAVGVSVLGYAVCFGLGALMNTSALLFTTIKLVGAAYLIFLGYKVWKDDSIGRTQHHINVQNRSHLRLFFEGLFISLTNPKAIALLAALFPPFLDQNNDLFIQASILVITFSTLCLINHMVLIYFAEKLQHFLTNDTHAGIIRRVLGGLFVSFGIGLAALPR